MMYRSVFVNLDSGDLSSVPVGLLVLGGVVFCVAVIIVVIIAVTTRKHQPTQGTYAETGYVSV